MRPLNRFIAFSCITLISLFFGRVSYAHTVKFATEATYPPFVYINNQGEICGFDVDIAKALCQEENLECSFANQPWDSLIPSLQFGKFDALIGAIAITPERLEKVAFTQPYYENTADYVIPANKQVFAITPGTIIGVQAGTTLADYLTATYGDKIQINRYASAEQAFLDLIATRIDAVFGDTPVVSHWVKQGGKAQFKLATNTVHDTRYLGNGFGIAVRKNEPALLNKLNTGLTKIKSDGRYQAIYKKYFD